MHTDEKYMRIALGLAQKAEGFTSPNPLVGAVVVNGGKVEGRGYHERCGLPHAEVNALRQAGKRAKGAVLYVTLEPCDHFGRTPPCTDAIIRSGIKKVVIAMKDPNPINNGRGMARLIKSGLKVRSGILEKEAAALNKPYIKFITKKIPYITVKTAQSLDGKIATHAGESRWITSKDARRYVHNIRSMVDAVMVGANTAMKDDPLLLSKPLSRKQPVRIVVDGSLKLSSEAKLFSKIGISPVIIAASKGAPRNKKKLYEAKGAKVLELDSRPGKINLVGLAKALGKMGIMHMMVEGGGELIASLLEDRLVDRFLIFIAPKIIGGRDAATFVEGRGAKHIGEALSLKELKVTRFKKDILIEAEASY